MTRKVFLVAVLMVVTTVLYVTAQEAILTVTGNCELATSADRPGYCTEETICTSLPNNFWFLRTEVPYDVCKFTEEYTCQHLTGDDEEWWQRCATIELYTEGTCSGEPLSETPAWVGFICTILV